MTRLIAASLLSFIFSLAAHAASGSWTQKTTGGSLSVGRQILTSRILTPPADVPASSQATLIHWRITLLSPPPPGLEIKLCTPQRCIPLRALQGTQAVSAPLRAGVPYRFIYSVNRSGQLTPALSVVSNQLTVNYR